MAEVKWIKLATGLPDNKKIKRIRRLPEGDTIALLWVFLMCLAGETNDDGMVYFTPEIPYTDEMLADQFNMDVNIVRAGLATFCKFGMIEIVDDIIHLEAWEKWQSVDKLAEFREQNRKRVANYRARKRLAAGNATGNVTCNVTVTQCNAPEEEREEEREEDPDKKEEIRPLIVSKDTICSTDVQRILDKWNGLGLSQVRAIQSGTQRYNLLKKRIKDYGSDAVLEAVGRIQKSSFLMGSNKNGWVITFDWFIKPNNFAKVLDGNYDDGQAQARRERVGSGRHHGMSEEQSILEGVGDWY